MLKHVCIVIASLCLALISLSSRAYQTSIDTSGEKYQLHDKNGQCRYTFIDMHFHPTNFVSDGDSLKKIAEDSRRACIKTILINVLPLIKLWHKDYKIRPMHYTDDDSKLYWSGKSEEIIFNEYLALDKADQDKFVFLMNGFNPSDKNSIFIIKKLLKIYSNNKIPIVGFGEIIAKHDKLDDQTYGGTPHINHPAIEPILKLAEKNNWFVLIHNNIGNQSFQGYSMSIYLNDLKELLSKNKNLSIILGHAGISRNITVKDHAQLISNLLEQYENLYIDISWVVYENYIYRNNKLSEKWIKLIKKYPDRFLIGSDNIGGYGKDLQNIKKYIPLLDALPRDIADKISHGNAQKLIDKARRTVP